MYRVVFIVSLMSFLLGISGCGWFQNMHGPLMNGGMLFPVDREPYGGVARSIDAGQIELRNRRWGGALYWYLIDAPLSIVFDTLSLPKTLDPNDPRRVAGENSRREGQLPYAMTAHEWGLFQ